METKGFKLRQTLNQLEASHRLRKLKTVTMSMRPEIVIEGNKALDFCSNDYLGFSSHPRLIEAARKASEIYGTGTGSARLIGGTFDLHMELEEELRKFKGTEAALLFNSGYQANVGVLSALIGRNDLIFADRLNHASLVDGALLSRGKLIRYPHCDMKTLEKHLESAPKNAGKFIVSDTVFSMDGDLAPLEDLFELSCQYDAWLILDEAHASGIFGSSRRSGLWETTGLAYHEHLIQIGTFSKALGSFGAYVAASKDLIDTLIQFSRSFIYSTSLPPAVVAANLEAIRLVQSDSSYTKALWENIDYFKELISSSLSFGIKPPVNSPIIPIIIGNTAESTKYAESLLALGIYVQAIRPPTVPEGTSRLRITLTAKHTKEHIKKLVNAMLEVMAGKTVMKPRKKVHDERS